MSITIKVDATMTLQQAIMAVMRGVMGARPSDLKFSDADRLENVAAHIRKKIEQVAKRPASTAGKGAEDMWDPNRAPVMAFEMDFTELMDAANGLGAESFTEQQAWDAVMSIRGGETLAVLAHTLWGDSAFTRIDGARVAQAMRNIKTRFDERNLR